MADPVQVYVIRIDDSLGTGWNYTTPMTAVDDQVTVITQAEVIGANLGQRPDLTCKEGRMFVTATHSTQYSSGIPQTIGHSMYRVVNGVLVFVYTDGWGPA